MSYTEAEWDKIKTDRSEWITSEQARELLDVPGPERPRVYGYWDGFIVKVSSVQMLLKYTESAAGLERLWVSHTTISDLIKGV